MDVSVDWKGGQRWLQATARCSLLGEGMLDRARATSLALLGATAAVGLAIVALALNQGWPLIAGSSIPRVPPQHQDVAAASVVSQPRQPIPSRAGIPAGSGRHRAGHASPPGAGAGSFSAPAPSADVVVSPSTPAHSAPTQGSPAPHPHDTSTPQPAQHSPTAPASPSPAPPPPAAPAAAPTATPTSVPAPAAPPVATTSEAPVEESNLPAWSNGNGHAYGRSEGWSDHGSDD